MGALSRIGRLLGAAAMTVGAATVAVAAGPAGPAAAAGCTAPNVVLAVDFRHWSSGFDGNGSAGNLVTACVPFTSSMKGIDLFRQGGFTTAGTQHDGPQFLCRLNGLPTASGNPAPRTDEPCSLTPPASAYWSYWYAKPGATSWTYSSYGAYSNTVTAGSIEAWTYGATDVGGTYGQPTFSPQSLMPTAAASGGSGGGSGGGAAAGGSAGSNGGGAASSGATGANPTASAGGSGRAGTSGPAPSAGASGSSATASPSPTGSATPCASPTAVAASGTATPGPTTSPSTSPTTTTPAPSPSTSAPCPTPDASGTGTSQASPATVDIDAISNPAGVTRSGTPLATVATIAVLVVVGGVGGGFAWKRKRSSS